jgi:esterase/lipase
MKLLLLIIRFQLRIVAAFSKEAAAKYAFRLFQRTNKKRLSKHEEVFYKNAKSYQIQGEQETFPIYEMGPDDGALVFLVHGWNSNAGSMAKIAEQLANNGFYCILFDLPGHGTSTLKHSNLKLCKERFKQVLKRYTCDRKIHIIAHSFGSAVVANTLFEETIKPGHLVFLSCPDSIKELFIVLQEQLKLKEDIFKRILKLAEELLKEPLSEITMINKTKGIQYNDLLLLHDKQDKVLPYSYSQQLADALPKSRLFPFEKIGHYRMLLNEGLIHTLSTCFLEKEEATFSASSLKKESLPY